MWQERAKRKRARLNASEGLEERTVKGDGGRVGMFRALCHSVIPVHCEPRFIAYEPIDVFVPLNSSLPSLFEFTQHTTITRGVAYFLATHGYNRFFPDWNKSRNLPNTLLRWRNKRKEFCCSFTKAANLKQKGETRWFFEVALALGIGKGSCKNSYCQKNRVIETEGRNGTKRRILFVLRTSTSTNELSLTRNRLRDKMC
uniref:Uncharacterized protein n=1 Tax=Vespula pensylvanica TaxID=30213 RepID=A0A834UGN5_VESPE|nr:hypothetical protein H0235_001041 [Vespula pensylvanica]